jgi:formate dehydrogenase major subunit
MCLVNLALLTGNLGHPGSGVNPLRGQNNVQGAALMGCEPQSLPGGAPVSEHLARFDQAWHTAVPQSRGLDLLEMMDAAESGSLKALWSIGYDVAMTNPNASRTRAALTSLDFLIVQDLFLNETARCAGTIFFPACSSFEKEGTFMNSERRIQRVRKVIEPQGQSKSDWRILCDVARAMGQGAQFRYESAEAIWNEVRSVWPDVAGITYGRLEDGGIQWPCPSEAHAGTAVLHKGLFDRAGDLTLQLINYVPTSEHTSSEFPYLLVTGRTLYQFNCGSMSRRSSANDLHPDDVLLIAPTDARALTIATGEVVRLCSQRGEVLIKATVSPAVRAGELFATFHTNDVFTNRLTSSVRDHRVDTPEYKVTAVRIEPY